MVSACRDLGLEEHPDTIFLYQLHIELEEMLTFYETTLCPVGIDDMMDKGFWKEKAGVHVIVMHA